MLITCIHFKVGPLLFIKANVWVVELREVQYLLFLNIDFVFHEKKKLDKKFLE